MLLLNPILSQAASTVISGTLTITNHAALTNATSGQSYTLNSDTRTFTNAVANAATQIRVRTNDSAATILLSIAAQAGAYPFSDITSFTTSAGTNITFRATNDIALTITLSPTNWGRVTYSTQTLGTAQTIVRVPVSAEDSSVRTNIVELILQALNDYSSSRAFTNWSFISPTFGGTFKLRNYIILASPFSVDGSGAVFQTTNSSPYFGQALFSGTAATNANYVEYRIAVPEDIDTSVDLKVERFKFRLNGADTNAVTFNIGMASVADSASYDSPTLGQWIALSFAGDISGASGDVETISNTTLTGWRSNVTAGRFWVIRLNRDGAGDASTVGTYSGPLVISYGLVQ